jgi:hypothetical protein
MTTVTGLEETAPLLEPVVGDKRAVDAEDKSDAPPAKKPKPAKVPISFDTEARGITGFHNMNMLGMYNMERACDQFEKLSLAEMLAQPFPERFEDRFWVCIYHPDGLKDPYYGMDPRCKVEFWEKNEDTLMRINVNAVSPDDAVISIDDAFKRWTNSFTKELELWAWPAGFDYAVLHPLYCDARYAWPSHKEAVSHFPYTAECIQGFGKGVAASFNIPNPELSKLVKAAAWKWVKESQIQLDPHWAVDDALIQGMYWLIYKKAARVHGGGDMLRDVFERYLACPPIALPVVV